LQEKDAFAFVVLPITIGINMESFANIIRIASANLACSVSVLLLLMKVLVMFVTLLIGSRSMMSS
jgi:hypothetical protein